MSGARFAYSEQWIGKGGTKALSQRGAVLEEVEKARAGNFHFADARVCRQCINQLLGQVAGLHPGGLGQHHRDIAGEVPVGLVTGVLHLDGWVRPLRQHAFSGETGQGLLDQMADAVFHDVLGRP